MRRCCALDSRRVGRIGAALVSRRLLARAIGWKTLRQPEVTVRVPANGIGCLTIDGGRWFAVVALLSKRELGVEVFADQGQAWAAIFEYLEVFYNRVRRHSSLGFVSPAEYERAHSQTHR